ncbi:MAG: DJ-1/PfpI family protein [Alphaproteobacteria bacterium]|nr:DJ-1/PfpI family protein [Alphaproteobacteria bacterium]
MEIQILLYDRMTALDAIGPYECLSRLDDAVVKMVGSTKGEIRTDTGFLGLTVDHSVNDVGPCDIILLPGGDSRAAMADEEIKSWVIRQHETTRFTTSVCTGSLILAAAGVIPNGKIASHWGAEKIIPKFGLSYSGERITQNGKIITAAGVSAGIDMGLWLCEALSDREMAQAIGLGLEYNPQPPHPYRDDDKLREIAIKKVT